MQNKKYEAFEMMSWVTRCCLKWTRCVGLMLWIDAAVEVFSTMFMFSIGIK